LCYLYSGRINNYEGESSGFNSLESFDLAFKKIVCGEYILYKEDSLNLDIEFI